MAFDDSTKKALERMSQKALSFTPEMAQEEAVEGLDQSGLLKSAQDMEAGRRESLGGDTALMSRALDNKMSQRYKENVNRMERLAKGEAVTRPYEELRRAMQGQQAEMSALNQDSAMAMRRYQLAKQKEAGEKKARSETLGSVLGLVGAGVGAAVGGGAGAGVGQKIGSFAGSAASS